MPEDLDRGPLFLDQDVGGPEGELTPLFLLLYCDTPWALPPCFQGPHTGLTCRPGREGRTALMTFNQLLYLTPNKLLPLWKQPGPFFGFQGLLTTLFSMQGGI